MRIDKIKKWFDVKCYFKRSHIFIIVGCVIITYAIFINLILEYKL